MSNTTRLKNLKTATERTREECRKNGSKGGKVASENRKKRKLLQDVAIRLLNEPADQTLKKCIGREFPTLDAKEITNGLVMLIALCKKAFQGNTKAFEILRDTAGEKPGEKLDVSNEDGSLRPRKLEVVFVPPSFEEKDALENE